MIKKLLGKTKKSLIIQSPFWCDYGYNIVVGENFYANHGCTILDAAKDTFGDNVFIGFIHQDTQFTPKQEIKV